MGLVLCTLGAYVIASRGFDIWVMLSVGVVCFLLRRRGYPVAPFVLGIVLIVLGSVAGVSIAGLFNAGFLVAGVLLATLVVLARWKARHEQAEGARRAAGAQHGDRRTGAAHVGERAGHRRASRARRAGAAREVSGRQRRGAAAQPTPRRLL